MSFEAIPLRQNGQKFFYDWFNSLRSAGLLIEQFLGTSYISETSFSLANNQVAAANVTGLVFDKDDVKSAEIHCEVRRKTTTNENISCGRLIAIYRDLTTTWELIDELGGDDDGVVFSITSAGQIQYTSDNLSGSSYSGTIKFKAMTFTA